MSAPPKGKEPGGFEFPPELWARYERMTWSEKNFENRAYCEKRVSLPVGQVFLAVWLYLSQQRREQRLPPLTDEDWYALTIEEINAVAEKALSQFLEEKMNAMESDLMQGRLTVLRPLSRTL
ncbi:hypothetical protein [Accumulibacter sp.]|uniref:hypothetical protein n=1 Tax=Accumulibacter sp. TaxID=2053492 RepID=UPI00287AB7BE|nr:hypothetical protein [Accumulibacter sp.]MDS4055363.1 hypothetical protein [Accumulibacter sp.]